ncbi:hypothetical protein C8J57DRAFT_1303846 [Mycena rebaudengoi]|nr:hypothetical protein C8J57DRAFT_1303846 [Mycena rebaudengoi]
MPFLRSRCLLFLSFASFCLLRSHFSVWCSAHPIHLASCAFFFSIFLLVCFISVSFRFAFLSFFLSLFPRLAFLLLCPLQC